MQGLDPDTEIWLYQFIDELPDFLRCAMLVISHDLHWVMRGSRRVICLNKSIFAAKDSPVNWLSVARSKSYLVIITNSHMCINHMLANTMRQTSSNYSY